MQAGKLRHRIAIQRPAAGTADGMGGSTGAAPTTIATVWAEITALTARERDLAKGVETERTHTVALRYRADVDEACTLAELTGVQRAFRVTGVMDIEGRRRELTLACVEIPSDAGAPS